MLRPVTALRSLVFVVFAVSACASSRGVSKIRGIPACQGFQLDLNPITARPEGDTIPLGPGGLTRIIFAPGAVSQNTTYNVNGVTNSDGHKAAGVGFTPGTGDFEEPVLLRISLAGCGSIDNERLHIVIKDADGRWKSIGGAKSKRDRYVEAYVPHFTDFAIAL